MPVTTELVRIVDGCLVPVPGVWEFDIGHTEIGFEGIHLKVSRVRGRFTRFSGRLIVAERPEDSQAELTIDASSLESGFKDRDDHLKSADWFDVEHFPTINFHSQGVRHLQGSLWTASGELTIKGIARRLDAEIEFAGAITDPWGNSKIGASVRAEVDREAWGLTWNVPLEAGGFVVSRKIQLAINIEAIFRG